MDIKAKFVKVSQKIAELTGHPFTFIGAAAVIIVWALCGPIFGFSDTWQLIINTSTTIITFLMVFLIQSTQNRDTEALHLKLDELIRATKGAHLVLMDIEKLDEDDFQAFRRTYDKMAEEARENLENGTLEMDCPEIQLKDLYAHRKAAQESK